MSMDVMSLRVAWALDLLGRAGIPVSANAIAAMVAWATAEGGGVQTENIAHYNPCNTTYAEVGSVVINGAGVRAYTSYEQGMAATVATLQLHYYDAIVADLKVGANPLVTADAIGASPWGTNGQLVVACIPEAAAAVRAYWTPPVPAAPPAQGDPMFVKETNGTVWWFVADGTNSYYREVPTAGAAELPAAMVIDDKTGALLAMWRKVPAT